MKVVVTGGAGFIGANLCRVLGRQPGVDRLVVLDDLSTGHAENLGQAPGAELVVGSVLDDALVGHVLDGAGAVVHLAARPSVPRSLEDPRASHDVNATGTLTVLEAARGPAPPHVVVASSSSVYGSDPPLPTTERSATSPRSPYGASKLAAEAYTLAYGRSFGLPVLAFRFFNVFGPLQDAGHAYAAVIPTFVRCALAGEPLPVHGDGRQTRDFTFVDSVTAVLAEAVRSRVTSDGPVNLAFGSQTSLLGLVALLAEVVGSPLETVHLDPRAGDVRDSRADRTRLGELFPTLAPVALRDGLAATVAWMEGVGRDGPGR